MQQFGDVGVDDRGIPLQIPVRAAHQLTLFQPAVGGSLSQDQADDQIPGTLSTEAIFESVTGPVQVSLLL